MCLPLTIMHLCMKYEICTLKTTQVIVSEPKCWQSSVLTLTFDLLTSKCIGIFLSPSCIYVWNMKAVPWKLLKLSCQNQSVDRQTKFSCDLDLLTSKCIVVFLSPSCIYVWYMCIWKLYIKNYSSYRVRTKVLTKFRQSSIVTLTFDLLTSNA